MKAFSDKSFLILQAKIFAITATGGFLIVNELAGREIYVVTAITETMPLGLIVGVATAGDNSKVAKAFSC